MKILLLLIITLLISCGNSSVAGGGSEAEAGRIMGTAFLPNGTKAVHDTVSIVRLGTTEQIRTVTDGNGSFSVELDSAGSFWVSLVAQTGGTTVRVADSSIHSCEIITGPADTVNLTILIDSVSINSSEITLPDGTTLFSADGRFAVPAVIGQTVPLTVRRGTVVQTVLITANDSVVVNLGENPTVSLDNFDDGDRFSAIASAFGEPKSWNSAVKGFGTTILPAPNDSAAFATYLTENDAKNGNALTAYCTIGTDGFADLILPIPAKSRTAGSSMRFYLKGDVSGTVLFDGISGGTFSADSIWKPVTIAVPVDRCSEIRFRISSGTVIRLDEIELVGVSVEQL